MIEKLFLNLIGYGVLAALLYTISRCNARRWNRLALVYRAPDQLQIDPSRNNACRTMQTVILVGGNVGWNSYNGLITVSVTEQGLLLQLMRPFSAFHSPLLIPFGEIQIEPKRWCLIGKTFQLTLKRVSDVQIIVHDDLLKWIELQASRLATSSESPNAVSVPA